jgi:2-isopropylmalate synthase
VTEDAKRHVKTTLGIHTHNDIGCGVANTIMAVIAGARHIQGTINGLGERTGNADLVQILPTLIAKLHFKALYGLKSLRTLREVSRLVYDLAGLAPNPYQPYVGENAFAHKAGVHVDALLKTTAAYEHINPEILGNERNIAISELSGTANLVNYAVKVLNVKVEKKDERLKNALAEIKRMEHLGYSFDSAPASALLILMRHLGMYHEVIKLDYWKVISEAGNSIGMVKANSKLRVAEGSGPVHAVDTALRQALLKDFPSLSNISLTDYKVILPTQVKNTESTVRVTVEFSDHSNKWRTMGVSSNVIEASVKALLDGLDYYIQHSRDFGKN